MRICTESSSRDPLCLCVCLSSCVATGVQEHLPPYEVHAPGELAEKEKEKQSLLAEKAEKEKLKLQKKEESKSSSHSHTAAAASTPVTPASVSGAKKDAGEMKTPATPLKAAAAAGSPIKPVVAPAGGASKK